MAPISRRAFLRSGATLLGVGALSAACGAEAPSAPPAGQAASPVPAGGAAQATSAALATAGEPVPALLRSGNGEEEFFNKAIDLFEQQHAGTKINRIFVPGGSDYTTKLDLMIASGDPPAIYAPFSDRGYRYYAARGLSQSLDDFVARDKFDLSDFHPDGMKGCLWDGKLMALPLDLWPHMIFYNKTLFRDAQVPDLTTDWNDASWNTDKYLEVARKLTKKDGDRVTQFGSDAYFNYWATGWIFGGDFLPPKTYEEGIVTEFAGDTDARVLAGVQWAADLMLKEKVAPSPSQSQQVQGGAPSLFMSGKIGMAIDNIGRLSDLAKVTEFEWGVAPAPNPPNGEKRHLHVWIDFWSMIAGVKNLDGAWELLKFMVSPDAQRIYPLQYGPQSSRLSLGKEWLDVQKGRLKITEAEIGVMTEAPKYEQIDPENWTVNFSPINSQALQPALDKIWLGEQTPSDAITAAAPAIRKLIDETKTVKK
jgi:ABC-type glycerol-3-phosphate transport system substrate-binding protein